VPIAGTHNLGSGEVSHRIEITTDRGESLVVPIEGDKVWLGSGEASEVRVRARGVAPRQLCFVRTDHGYRVEPAVPGATVDVNGESLFCKDLDTGDRIEVAGLKIRWLADASPAVPGVRSRTARRGSAAVDRRSTRAPRSRRSRSWVPVSALIAAVLLVLVFALRSLSGSTWPHSPQHYVDLARAQLSNDEPQRAMDTIAFALREAVGSAREEALALEAEIHRRRVERSEQPKVTAARQQHELLLSFVARNLRDAVTRPAARELVRMCDQWLALHTELCSRNAEGEPMLRATRELRSQYAAIAAIGEPDTAEDVLFAARSRLGYRWRDYLGAMQKLDEFLRAHPDAAELQQERDRMIAEGEQWLEGRLHGIDALLDRGDTGTAALDLDQLERWSMLPEWRSKVAPRRSRLERER
jgi:hypothetical protein